MIGKMFIHALLEENSVAPLVQHGDIEHLFKASEVEVYAFVRDFVRHYQALPTEATIKSHTGETLTPGAEPAGYYLDLMKARHVEHSLKKGMQGASEYLHPGNKDPEKALEAITGTVMELVAQRTSLDMVDFRQAYDVIMGAYAAKYMTSDTDGLRLGWPSFDNLAGGLGKGDVVSMIGRPAAGKSMQLLYAAHHGWERAEIAPNPGENQSRLFVSMEMTTEAIQQRLAAMHAHIPASQLKHAALSSLNLGKMKSGLKAVQGFAHPFYVLDGNLAATVEDIWMLARQLNPGAIFVDGAYLLKHPTERDRYKRVAENADLIKQELAKIAPTVCSWQFAKSAAKKNVKKGEKAGLEDIGYSDAISQVSAIVLGLFEEESVETIKSRKIDILKGRNGETGEFVTNWNWHSMDFSEVEHEDIAELQFL